MHIVSIDSGRAERAITEGYPFPPASSCTKNEKNIYKREKRKNTEINTGQNKTLSSLSV